MGSLYLQLLVSWQSQNWKCWPRQEKVSPRVPCVLNNGKSYERGDWNNFERAFITSKLTFYKQTWLKYWQVLTIYLKNTFLEKYYCDGSWDQKQLPRISGIPEAKISSKQLETDDIDIKKYTDNRQCSMEWPKVISCSSGLHFSNHSTLSVVQLLIVRARDYLKVDKID